MRVGLITWDYPPQPTGLGRAAGEIAAGLRAEGAEVTVFTLDRGGEEIAEGIGLIGCAVSERSALGVLRPRMAAGHLAVPWRIKRLVAANGPFDVVETTNWYAPGGLVAGSAALVVRNSTPAIEARDPNASLRDRIDLAFAHRFEASTARRADGLISNAPHHKQAIERWYGLGGKEHHAVIPLSLSAEWLERGRQARAPFEGDVPTVLFIGRAEKRKGFRELVEGFALLRRDMQARLVLAGLSDREFDEGTSGLGLPQEVRSSIDVRGRVGDEELLRLFEEADLIAAPSRYESYGLVYREAAAFGRPLLACAEDPSALDLIGQHPIGVLAERCRGQELAEALAMLLTDKDQARLMGRAGLKMAEGLSRERLGAETLKVYEEALRRKRGGGR
ncbi:glycosyltransferase family 4 protein [Parvularcula maris]|uniref:Glycosyltransferase family 4 protein n=1 Tax=Parvularcula maris TaxID=2965077 RepID=A0A9X2L7P1_9PROT|nr:glycosyltransferase family 4 protein [Parvularcula maris]MCQ8184451.1 glycosyltransferase family 4 protein [Parvularcula maris]